MCCVLHVASELLHVACRVGIVAAACCWRTPTRSCRSQRRSRLRRRPTTRSTPTRLSAGCWYAQHHCRTHGGYESIPRTHLLRPHSAATNSEGMRRVLLLAAEATVALLEVRALHTASAHWCASLSGLSTPTRLGLLKDQPVYSTAGRCGVGCCSRTYVPTIGPRRNLHRQLQGLLPPVCLRCRSTRCCASHRSAASGTARCVCGKYVCVSPASHCEALRYT